MRGFLCKDGMQATNEFKGSVLWDGFWEEVEMQEDGVSEAAILMERAGDLFEAILYMLSIFDLHDT